MVVHNLQNFDHDRTRGQLPVVTEGPPDEQQGCHGPYQDSNHTPKDDDRVIRANLTARSFAKVPNWRDIGNIHK